MAFNFSSLTIDIEEFFKEESQKYISHENDTKTSRVTELHPCILFLAISFSRFNTHSKI